MENGIKPGGIPGDDYENSCNKTTFGWGCSAKYLYE